jgi:hypothetical protein
MKIVNTLEGTNKQIEVGWLVTREKREEREREENK